jgi:RNA polymerase sigma-70 factor (ECF subfamily)
VIDRVLTEIVRCERPMVLAALVSFCRDLDLAEDAFQDACLRAHQTWPDSGVPAKPGAWLHTVARRRCLDHLRRNARSPVVVVDPNVLPEPSLAVNAPDEELPDERLRLIFICCHPVLTAPAQVALALRHICGLTTLEISRAFVEAESTTAQRLVRAKNKIRDAGVPYAVPEPEDLSSRLESVLTTLYLLFNEGYSATGGDSWLRPDLSAEAIRLSRLVVELLPAEAEARGLLALMTFHHARRDSRISADGQLILLEQQNRSLWHRAEIESAQSHLDLALSHRRPGPYQIQASIAALHTTAPSPEQTDWRQIALLYGALLEINPSPVIQLNAAVACAFAYGIEHGIAWITRLENGGELTNYPLLHAAKAELFRRIGNKADAIASYDQAIHHTRTAMEKEHLIRRRAELS